VLHRDRQQPSKIRERGGSWRRRGPPQPRNCTTPGRGAKCAPTSPPRSADINTQLTQARELEAKLAEEYRAVRLLRASITGEASARGGRVRELGKQARERINTDFDVDNPSTPHERARSSSLPRRCCGPCPLLQRPRRGTCTARRSRSSSKRLCNRPRARRPAFASRGARGTTGARKALRHQFMRAPRRGSLPAKTGRRSGIGSLTRASRPKTATLATSSMPDGWATQRHG
jgi:hypothetical protein